MLQKIIFCLLLTFCFQALGAEKIAGKVTAMRGEVLFENSPLQKDDLLKTNGLIETKANSFVKIHNESWGTDIVLGPNTKMVIDLNADEEKKIRYSIVHGFCRWLSDKQKKEDSFHHLAGKISSVGVRGTDFLFLANEILVENELVVFDGEVEFTSLQNKNEKMAIIKGHWGGIGGRFGPSLKKPLKLDQKTLDYFKKLSEF